MGKATHTQRPFIFPEESPAEVYQHRLSRWKSSPGPLPTGRSSRFPVVCLGYSAALILWPGHLAPRRSPQQHPVGTGYTALCQVPGGAPSLGGEKGPPGVITDVGRASEGASSYQLRSHGADSGGHSGPAVKEDGAWRVVTTPSLWTSFSL